MKRFIALVAAIGLCTALGMGCKKMAAPTDAPEDKPAEAAETTPPPPPPPPATPAEAAEPEKKAE